MVMTALLCISCSEELSVLPPAVQPGDSLRTDLIFTSGLRRVMTVGERDTVNICWEHGLLSEDDQRDIWMKTLRGKDCVRVDSLEYGFGISALCDGMTLLRAGIGGHYYRDFLITVESHMPEETNRDYRSSTRVGIDGIGETTLTAYVPYVLRASLDGKSVSDQGHIYLDDGKEDISSCDFVFFEPGEHLLLSEVEMGQTGVVLYRRFAVQAWQRDDLVLFAGLVDDSSDRLGNAAVYLGYSIPGGASNIYLSICRQTDTSILGR